MSSTREAPTARPTPTRAGVRVERRFTRPGVHPFDVLEWEVRDAVIGDPAKPAFVQRDVEFPRTWSQNATNIVAQKYFRGNLDTPERERSVRQMILRVAGTITRWGREGGYFAGEEDAEAFEAELVHILVNQQGAFNSPVWFNVGWKENPQSSACQPYDALISTPEGMVPIGELVALDQVGREVYDSVGTTRVVAVKSNGRKPVWRVTLRNGQFIEATPDHVVKAVHSRRKVAQWLRVDQLEAGMRLHLHPHRARVANPTPVLIGAQEDQPLFESLAARAEPAGERAAVAEAALAGWLQADGFVGQYETGTNRSLTIEFQVANDDEYRWVMENLDIAMPDLHRHVRDADTQHVRVRRIRLYGEVLREFVEDWGLLDRGTDIRVPSALWTATPDEISAYLRSIFQADGYVTVRREHGYENGRVCFAVIGQRWTEDVQLLLNTLGIYSRRLLKKDKRDDRHDLHEVVIGIGSERARFAELVGFVGPDKQRKLLESLDLRGLKRCGDLREEEIVSIEQLGVDDVYDIQTESGEYLSNNVSVHNCFILSVDDNMESILNWNTEEGLIFRGGSGSGVNLSNIRASTEQLSKGGTASGPVSFMRGADSWAGSIKSGGGTRRAAKMVVLDADHPDIREFIWCKAREEDKAAALRAAGFDMSIDGDGFHSIQYQNANNSVRLTDDFMRAVEDDGDWQLTARTTGQPVETIKARELMREIAEAAWRCADPGVQYDTTINDWHTTAADGRISASNPCFPADAKVHTTLGLLPFGELYQRARAGEDFRVYTHRATGVKPARWMDASRPVAVMRNGVKAIVRLRFSNGQDLRCTPNHRIWTLNRGYVAAEELTADDRVMLNDLPTPATDASWELPVKVEALAVSRHRGGTQVAQRLPDRWSEGLGETIGHLVGDGCMTEGTSVWVYGGDDIDDGLLESHEGLLRELIGGSIHSVATNGTEQLGAGSEAVRELLRGLGVSSGRAHAKRVPASIFQAPTEVQASFLRGLFGADGCASRIEGGKANRYVGLGSRSELLLKDVQRLLSNWGIRGRIYSVTGSGSTRFSYRRRNGTEVSYDSKPGYDLRITGTDLERFSLSIGFSTPRKRTALDSMLDESMRYETESDTRLLTREPDGQEVVYNLTEPLNHSYIVDGIVVANCSEFVSNDNTACNLASINLMKYRNEDGSFEVEDFEATVDTLILAQEIIVDFSSYPTEKITQNARRLRQLGLGYANLGALLMSNGLPYDSDDGRSLAASITALMTGRAYRRSAEIAAAMGPYEGYEDNRESHDRVMRMHHAAASDQVAGEPLGSAALRAWDDVLALGHEHGFRNAQATLLAPTGTISFLMDCDTTGVEPDFSLVKYKELVGGGHMTIVNQTVPRALHTLGYSDSDAGKIVRHIDANGTIVGAPGLRAEHLPVFDVAVGERAIGPMGHIAMMGAVQPFLSGAISKTVNMPFESTADDIADAYTAAWRLGVKALAIYRDGSKTAQALRTDAHDKEPAEATPEPVVVERAPARRRMPRERQSITHKFSIGGHEGYITAGMYEDGTLGEIFLTDIGKEGSTLRGMMNAFATSISIALQYGVPLDTLVRKFSYMRFDPEGITQNAEIPFAKSMPDYIMRWLASRFLDAEIQEELGILTPEVRARKSAQEALFHGDTAGPAHGNGHANGGGGGGGASVSQPGTTRAAAEAFTDEPPVLPARLQGLDLGPACSHCGGMMQRTGSCYTCSSCGNNTGCG